MKKTQKTQQNIHADLVLGGYIIHELLVDVLEREIIVELVLRGSRI